MYKPIPEVICTGDLTGVITDYAEKTAVLHERILRISQKNVLWQTKDAEQKMAVLTAVCRAVGRAVHHGSLPEGRQTEGTAGRRAGVGIDVRQTRVF